MPSRPPPALRRRVAVVAAASVPGADVCRLRWRLQQFLSREVLPTRIIDVPEGTSIDFITHDRRNGDAGQAALARSGSPRTSPAQAAQVTSTGGRHTTRVPGAQPDRGESSPITWRGSGESRLAPLRVVLLTRGVQRVSVRIIPGASAGLRGPDLYADWINAQFVPRPAVRSLRRALPGPPSTSTVGPAPLTTAGSPLPRSLCTSDRLSGIAGSRYSWCSRSSVAVSSSSGRPVSAATSRAPFPALAAASRMGYDAGSNPRASFVSTASRHISHGGQAVRRVEPNRPRRFRLRSRQS